MRDTEEWLASKGILVLPKPFNVDERVQAVRTQLAKAEVPPPSESPQSSGANGDE